MKSDVHVSEYLPAYALDCLDEEETLFVGEHLAGCPACRQELEGYQSTVGLLALSVEVVEPAPNLKQELLERARGEVPTAEVPPDPQPWWRRQVAALRGYTHLRWAVGVATLLLVSLVALGILATGRGKERTQVAEMQTFPMVATAASPGASGVLVMDGHGEYGTLVVDGLPELDADQVYQAWLIREGRRESGATFSLDQGHYGATLLWSEEPLIDFSAVEVTIEPAGGSASPTGPVVLAASIR